MKKINQMSRPFKLLGLITLLLFTNALAQDFQEEFNLSTRKLSPTGESRYFVLKPGFVIVLASSTTKLTITVLDETRKIGEVLTRVVEEREEERGSLTEISRNFFAIDPSSNDVFYFGEDVDIYQNGKVTGHASAWLAYQNGNKPGLMLPGTPTIGMRYYQELAPGVALDRAEITNLSAKVKTPAGQFEGCLITKESSRLEPGIGYKTYAPGIGLIEYENLKLTSYGYKR